MTFSCTPLPQGKCRRELKLQDSIRKEFKYRMSKDDKIFDPNDHLVGIAVRIVQVARSLPKTKVGNQISGQLIRRHSANCKQIKLV